MVHRVVLAGVVAGALLGTGCGVEDAPTVASTQAAQQSSEPPAGAELYALRRVAADPCVLLDARDESALRARGSGASGSTDDGIRTCVWLVGDGYGVGVWVDSSRVPDDVRGAREVRAEGRRVTQFRRESGAVCYSAVSVGRRAIVVTTDADRVPGGQADVCRVGRDVVARMLAHVRAR